MSLGDSGDGGGSMLPDEAFEFVQHAVRRFRHEAVTATRNQNLVNFVHDNGHEMSMK